MAVYGTFTGPDGETEITYKHNVDTCECSECDTARWQKIEREEMNRKRTEQKAQPGFHVGDTVKVTASDLDGQQGELRVIDPEASEGEFFGVYLESTQSTVFFCADEIEKVEIR